MSILTVAAGTVLILGALGGMLTRVNDWNETIYQAKRAPRNKRDTVRANDPSSHSVVFDSAEYVRMLAPEMDKQTLAGSTKRH